MKLQHMATPLRLDEMNFTEIRTIILSHIQPRTKLIIAERARFYGTKQEKNERISDFLIRLKEASQHCAFHE